MKANWERTIVIGLKEGFVIITNSVNVILRGQSFVEKFYINFLVIYYGLRLKNTQLCIYFLRIYFKKMTFFMNNKA